MKKLFIAIISFSLLLSCAPRKKKSDKIVVRFWHAFASGSAIGKTLEKMVDEFNQKHPKWYIKLEGMGSYPALRQKLLASIIAGNQPEMAIAYESWIAKFYKAGKLVILDELFESEKEKEELKNDIFKVFWQSCVYDGKLVALPFNKSTPVLYYNADWFKEHGIKKIPETWQEFIEIAKKFTIDKNGDGEPEIYGTISRANLTDFLDFLIQNGGKILDPDKKELYFNKKEGIEAMKFFAGLKYLYGVADFYTSGNPYAYQDDFASGKCAMIIGSCVSRFFMKRKLQFRLGTAPIFGNKKKAVQVYGTSVIIFNKATKEQRKVAWEFIKWFISPENTARWSVETAYMPVRKSALNQPILKKEFQKDPGLKSSILQLEYGFTEPRIDSWYLGRQYLSEAINNILIDGDVITAYKNYKLTLQKYKKLEKNYLLFKKQKPVRGKNFVEKLKELEDELEKVKEEKEKKYKTLEKVLEARIKYHLDKAADKMRRWML